MTKTTPEDVEAARDYYGLAANPRRVDTLAKAFAEHRARYEVKASKSDVEAAANLVCRLFGGDPRGFFEHDIATQAFAEHAARAIAETEKRFAAYGFSLDGLAKARASARQQALEDAANAADNTDAVRIGSGFMQVDDAGGTRDACVSAIRALMAKGDRET